MSIKENLVIVSKGMRCGLGMFFVICCMFINFEARGADLSTECMKHVCEGDELFKNPFGTKVTYVVTELFYDDMGEPSICAIGPRPRQMGSYHLVYCQGMSLIEGSLVYAYIHQIIYYDGMSKAPNYREILLSFK